MGAITKIEWCDSTFNPWIGCTKVSEGCKNCYAKTSDDRHLLGQVSHWGPGSPRHVTSPNNWREPIRWAARARQAGVRAKVFCASQADIFEAEAPVEARRNLWHLIGETCDALDWLLLTKRPENITLVMVEDGLNHGFFELTHCWLGTSTENQAAADRRIPYLVDVDCAVRFVSAEPLLDLVKIGDWLYDGLAGEERVDWVIVGGESGLGARPMHPDWARSLRDECLAAGVPYFFKQWGEFASVSEVEGSGSHHQFDDGATVRRVGKHNAGATLDGREWKQFPEVRP